MLYSALLASRKLIRSYIHHLAVRSTFWLLVILIHWTYPILSLIYPVSADISIKR
jgi:hypothetical protein